MEKARLRLERWKEAPPFIGNTAVFAERLAQAGLTEESLLALLAEPPESVKQRCLAPPSWMEAVEASEGRIDVPPEVARLPTAGFLEVVQPMLARGAPGLPASSWLP